MVHRKVPNVVNPKRLLRTGLNRILDILRKSSRILILALLLLSQLLQFSHFDRELECKSELVEGRLLKESGWNNTLPLAMTHRKVNLYGPNRGILLLENLTIEIGIEFESELGWLLPRGLLLFDEVDRRGVNVRLI